MKVFGIILLILGLLAIGGGLIGAVVSQLIPNEECSLAEQFKSEADRLNREADAARGTPNETKLREQALDKMRSAGLWAKGCSDRKTITTIAMIAGLIVAAVGFLLSIVGIFLFVRGRRGTAAVTH